MKQPEIDANRVIDNLTTRISALERENAILQAQLQFALKPIPHDVLDTINGRGSDTDDQ